MGPSRILPRILSALLVTPIGVLVYREPLSMSIYRMRFPGLPPSSQACLSVELSHHDWPLAEMCCPVAPSYTIFSISHGHGRVRALGSVGAVETHAHASLWPQEGQADGSLPIFSLP
jgi:hypothetical protein